MRQSFKRTLSELYSFYPGCQVAEKESHPYSHFFFLKNSRLPTIITMLTAIITG